MSDLHCFQNAAARTDDARASLFLRFRRTAAAGNPDLASEEQDRGGSLIVRARQAEVAVRSGQLARLTAHFRLGENRRATGRFLQAMSATYGAEITREVAAARKVTGGFGRIMPLTARKVSTVVRQAEHLQDSIRQNNRLLAECAKKVQAEGLSTESVSAEIDKSIQGHLKNMPGFAGSYSEVARSINAETVAAQVEQAVVEAGRDGSHRVSPEEARAIRRDTVYEGVQQALFRYAEGKSRALAQLDVRTEGSIAHQALLAAYQERGLLPRPNGRWLTSDAADELNRRFATAIAAENFPAEGLDDPNALHELASKVADHFVSERLSAWSAVDRLWVLTDSQRDALKALVLRDQIPAALVPDAADSLFMLRDELASLTEPRSPQELEDLIKCLHLVLTSTWRAEGAANRRASEDHSFRSLWRFLLAPMEMSEARTKLNALESWNSPLRGIGVAAGWYANDFRKAVADSEAAQQIFDAKSFETARETSNMLHWMVETLREKLYGEGTERPKSTMDACPDDATVALLRNLGIAFPAPDRVGQSNAHVSLSEPTLKALRNELDEHFQENGKTDNSGLAKNCQAFLGVNDSTENGRLKAKIYIDGQALPPDMHAEAVTEQLKAFCTGRNGRVNRKMLAGITRLVDPDTLRCVFAGCMNPDRPDTAIMSSYPAGVNEGLSFSLWKAEGGKPRLGIAHMITPLFLQYDEQGAELPGAGQRSGVKTGSDRTILNGHTSNFSVRLIVSFDPKSYRPGVEWHEIGYAFHPGDPEPPYWIPAVEGAPTPSATPSLASFDDEDPSPIYETPI